MPASNGFCNSLNQDDDDVDLIGGGGGIAGCKSVLAAGDSLHTPALKGMDASPFVESSDGVNKGLLLARWDSGVWNAS